MESDVIPYGCGCSSMAEQKLPKLPALADFRASQCKPPKKQARESAGLRMACKPYRAPASVPKADLALGAVTINLRTHRVVHRRISMGCGGSADSGAVLSEAVTCRGRRALSRPISNGGLLPTATKSYAGHATRRVRQSRWARSQAESSRPFSPCQSDSVAPF